MFIIEYLLDHRAGERLFANLNLHVGAEGGVGGVDECHADALVGRQRVVARRHLADGLAVHIKYGVAVTGYGLVVQFDPSGMIEYDSQVRSRGTCLC